MKQIIVDCCEKIIVPEKELKEGIYIRKGYEFDYEYDSILKFGSFLNDISTFFLIPTRTWRKSLYKRYKLQEDIKSKYTICPICKGIVWLDEPFNPYHILQGNWNCTEIKSWEGEWKEFC